MYWLIGALVVDLILVIIGSQLWKKANRLDPASKQSSVKFFLWNNMGLIASVICFLPIVILLLANKEGVFPSCRSKPPQIHALSSFFLPN